KNAVLTSDCLYIGIEPSRKQLEIHAKKANKDGLKNALFVVGTAEDLPKELTDKVDSTHVILPWGTLLKYVTQPDEDVLYKIAASLKTGGSLKIILGYSMEFEPSEVERLNLESISGEYIEKMLAPRYQSLGLKMRKMDILNKKALNNFETTWCKKLSFGKKRPMFYLEFLKI
ncbi:MAG: class I SAM-dependent methyltransferase, partial [Patescibacteria group bacterium]